MIPTTFEIAFQSEAYLPPGKIVAENYFLKTRRKSIDSLAKLY